MRKTMWLALALTLCSCLAAHAQDEAPIEEFSEVEYYAKLARETGQPMPGQETEIVQAVPEPVVQTAAPLEPAQYYAASQIYMAECEDDAPDGVFVVMPQYFNSRSGNATGLKLGPDKLKSRKSRANGMGFTAMFNKRLSDFFTIGLMYEYAFMRVNGGTAVPDAPAFDGWEKSRYYSHVVGVMPEFDLKEYGRVQLSFMQSFDGAGGDEFFSDDYHATIESRSIDKYRANVSSLMAWYEKDIALGCSGWTLTPYAGWRSLYVDMKNATDWSQADPEVRRGRNDWVHLANGGLKVGYRVGNFGFNLRGGVSHRMGSDDYPSFGNRAVAPGVLQFSHRANQDRTVGTAGAGISYIAPKRIVVSVGYDGYYGRDTSAHMGSLAFSLPF